MGHGDGAGDIAIVVGSPDANDRRDLVNELLRHNKIVTGLDDEELSAFLRDDAGNLVGGVYGWVFGGTGEVALLWVREDARGRGLGGRLLAAFEQQAAALGCHQMVMHTHSFQAPAFYRKHGYQDVAAIDDYPTGHAWHVLRKDLQAG